MASNLLPTTMEMTIAIRNRTRTTDGDIRNNSFSLDFDSSQTHARGYAVRPVTSL